MATQTSSREFNQATNGATKAAEQGRVYITERGRPAHVLLTYEADENLVGPHRMPDRHGQPSGVEDIAFSAPVARMPTQPATFD